MRNNAIDALYETLESYDTGAAGDQGICRHHVEQLFEDLNIDPNMTWTEFQERLQ